MGFELIFKVLLDLPQKPFFGIEPALKKGKFILPLRVAQKSYKAKEARRAYACAQSVAVPASPLSEGR